MVHGFLRSFGLSHLLFGQLWCPCSVAGSYGCSSPSKMASEVLTPYQSAKTQSVIVSTPVHARLSALFTVRSEASLLPGCPALVRKHPIDVKKIMSSGCCNPGPSPISCRISVLAVHCPESFGDHLISSCILAIVRITKSKFTNTRQKANNV